MVDKEKPKQKPKIVDIAKAHERSDVDPKVVARCQKLEDQLLGLREKLRDATAAVRTEKSGGPRADGAVSEFKRAVSKL